MSTVRKVPMRKCVGCGEMKSKKELIRVLRTPEGEILLGRHRKEERARRLPVRKPGLSGEGREEPRAAALSGRGGSGGSLRTAPEGDGSAWRIRKPGS